ncbi:putative 1-acylglycerol-3-phosphate O-acyltransferase [Rosa chinensis]|uniref:1-acylglycerol-3-phosphate O-acyltransferase n=1 Tax=Rosa chinensis TaxID=74649 RepID=A0A2P6RZN9_ROSCH|nr:1-acyl-sn-glycerol-3-phosphate acyltransferase 2 isoform X1 [Rosa chinensis]PRQ51886.1 putative 1-acylglycerol-3-phosphate O-acyltransferase [Rosa chinensis]
MVLPMAIALGILFAVVVVLYSLILHLIPVVLLCVSGLFANLVQAFCFVFIWPISKNAYTRINGVVKELDWLVLLGLIDWCAGVKILECIEQENSHLKGEEHELVISSARNDADPLLELVLAQWSGCLGSLLAVIKTSARYILVRGWPMWFSEYVFSERSAHDARKLKSDLKDFPQPFWFSVVLERTGFTQGELLAAQRLPVPSKVLSPDTKDLVYAVRRAYSVVPAIYVITVAIPKTSPPTTVESVIKGGPSVVHVYIKRHATKKWPETDDAVEKWCTEILEAEDALLDEHIAERTFVVEGLQAIGQPLKCFLVISLIVLWALKFNFVCCSTLLVLSAALFTGQMLTLFGCGVLSLLQCFMEAAIANISWSKYLKPICGWLIYNLGELCLLLPCD